MKLRSQGMVLIGLAMAAAAGCGRSGAQLSHTAAASPVEVKLVTQYDDFGTGIVYAAGHVFASSVYENKVHVFDATSHEQTATVSVGRGPLHLVTDGQTVYSVNQWAQDAGDAYISVIDAATQRVSSPLRVSEKQVGNDPNNYPWTNFPQDAALMKGQLFVSFPTNPQPDIIPVDTANWTERALFSGGHGPWRMTGVNDTLIVVNERVMGGTDDAILEITRKGELVATHETPGFLHQAISAGGRGWVSRTPVGTDKGLVMIVDPSTHEIRSVSVSRGPDGLAEMNGKIYVVCVEDRTIDVIDVESEKLVESISLSETTPSIARPRSIAVTPDGTIFLRSIDASAGGLPKGAIYVLTPRS